MKRIAWQCRFGLLLLVAAGGPSAGSAAPAAPAIVIEAADADLGEVLEGETLSHDFRFRNDGDLPLSAKGG
jgi:hypothetical protein